MKPTSDYSTFQADDFLSDESFLAWIASPSLETNAYWQDLLGQHPRLNIPFNQAVLLAQGMELSWTEFPDTYTQEFLERIHDRVEQSEKPLQPAPIRRLGWRFPIKRLAAAAAAVLVAGGLWTYVYYFTENTYTTPYGKTLALTLYDGSTVTLNANSRLSMPSRYAWHQERTVGLAGEAYFNVEKQPSESGGGTFTVKTQRVEVEVLGTHFNVHARPSRTMVLLDEGSIRLVERASRQPILMQPGQVVELTPRHPTAELSAANPEKARQLTGWRSNTLIFEDAGMEELAQRFEDAYGLELVLVGDAFTDQLFRGQLPLDDVNQALKILSETFDRRVSREGNRVYFVKQ